VNFSEDGKIMRIDIVLKRALSLPTLAAAFCSTSVLAQSTAQMQMGPDKPLLTISVSESVQAAPDIVSLGVGVQTIEPTASGALSKNSERMAQVMKAIRARKIPDRDIQTTGISMSIENDYSNVQPGQQPRFVGYRVSNAVKVTTRDLASLGTLIDVLVTAGGTSLDGPYFAIENQTQLLKMSRDRGMVKADAQAKEYATRAGFARARLVTITEGQGFSRPYEVMAAANAAAPSAPPPPPTAPGQVSTGVSITAQYQLER
jgi:uncharacterized protein